MQGKEKAMGDLFIKNALPIYAVGNAFFRLSGLVIEIRIYICYLGDCNILVFIWNDMRTYSSRERS